MKGKFLFDEFVQVMKKFIEIWVPEELLSETSEERQHEMIMSSFSDFALINDTNNYSSLKSYFRPEKVIIWYSTTPILTFHKPH